MSDINKLVKVCLYCGQEWRQITPWLEHTTADDGSVLLVVCAECQAGTNTRSPRPPSLFYRRVEHNGV